MIELDRLLDSQKFELEKQRRQLWIDVAVAVAGTENMHCKEGPGNWANVALAAFDSKFKTT